LEAKTGRQREYRVGSEPMLEEWKARKGCRVKQKKVGLRFCPKRTDRRCRRQSIGRNAAAYLLVELLVFKSDLETLVKVMSTEYFNDGGFVSTCR